MLWRCTVAALMTLVFGTIIAKADSQSFETIEHGRYLATLADCVACHTAPGGKPYAGGLPLQTPFGTLYSPNITPDEETGIGAWTDEDFIAALHDGIGRGGKRLYPAMPYPAYTKLSREDVLAIRTYLATLEPVKNAVDVNQLPFPFNQRSSLLFWNWLNFKDGRFQPNPQKSAEWNRGAYVVEALGHCGTCHSSKNILGGDKSANYLQGATLEGWLAPNITADPHKGIGTWSESEIVEYLKTGVNDRAIASGPMADEIINSSSKMMDSDAHAIAVYLKDLKSGTGTPPQPLDPNDARMIAGGAIYKDNCEGCHTSAGAGIPRLFPRLRGNTVVQSDDISTITRVVLLGSRGAATAAAPTGPAMPSFGWRLNDDNVAAVLTYIRNSWGNAAPPVASSDVGTYRKSANAGQ
ncbi:alcohol dehydrogenase [Pseudorhodoplanes sinuspersici]|uniref:Alcohol dehydrogenase n=2 Tax=Pseudorhodoplanes sinuspersici TaxID=1235591 RepID=A0A1W6ZS30_9HYPH|nr:alcohol dehydrogenase [Pseudorhodoplanes sinuspersici]